MITYRSAVASDVIDLISLVEEYCDEVHINHDVASIKKYIDFQLGKIPTIIADAEGKVVGVMSFVVMPNPFKSDEKIGRKIACFVSKDYRDQNIGTEMLEVTERLCQEQGAVKFYFSGSKPPEGYITFETEFYKDL